jgi:hypothetical protein
MKKIKSKIKSSEYFYIIKTPEFLNEPVYKIGKTAQEPFRRFNQYALNSKLIFCLEVTEIGCDLFEAEMIEIFKKKYKLYQCNEYFYGDHIDMINTVIGHYNARRDNGFATQVQQNVDLLNTIITQKDYTNLAQKKQQLQNFIDCASAYLSTNSDTIQVRDINYDLRDMISLNRSVITKV